MSNSIKKSIKNTSAISYNYAKLASNHILNQNKKEEPRKEINVKILNQKVGVK